MTAAAAEIERQIYIYIFFVCFQEAAEGSAYSQMVILNFTMDPLRSLNEHQQFGQLFDESEPLNDGNLMESTAGPP